MGGKNSKQKRKDSQGKEEKNTNNQAETTEKKTEGAEQPAETDKTEQEDAQKDQETTEKTDNNGEKDCELEGAVTGQSSPGNDEGCLQEKNTTVISTEEKTETVAQSSVEQPKDCQSTESHAAAESAQSVSSQEPAPSADQTATKTEETVASDGDVNSSVEAESLEQTQLKEASTIEKNVQELQKEQEQVTQSQESELPSVPEPGSEPVPEPQLAPEPQTIVPDSQAEPPVSEPADIAKYSVEFIWEHGGSVVHISGSFDDWNEKKELQKNDEAFKIKMDLAEGEHLYRFLVDEEWRINNQQPTKTNFNGQECNVIVVQAN